MPYIIVRTDRRTGEQFMCNGSHREVLTHDYEDAMRWARRIAENNSRHFDYMVRDREDPDYATLVNFGDTITPERDDADEEYVNEDCPEHCSLEHEEPEPDEDGQWSCPATGQDYYYCEPCGGWQPQGRYRTYPSRLCGTWYCDPSDHGYFYCDGCDDWRDDDDYGTIGNCENCSERWSEDDEDGPYGSCAEPVIPCGLCSSGNVHMDLATEQFVCDHRAVELLNAGRMVRLASEHPVARMLAGLRAA
jgi:hypothetical protein